MRIEDDSTNHQTWMKDLFDMSDQADGLRQLVQAKAALGSGPGSATAAVADPPARASVRRTSRSP